MPRSPAARASAEVAARADRFRATFARAAENASSGARAGELPGIGGAPERWAMTSRPPVSSGGRSAIAGDAADDGGSSIEVGQEDPAALATARPRMAEPSRPQDQSTLGLEMTGADLMAIAASMRHDGPTGERVAGAPALSLPQVHAPPHRLLVGQGPAGAEARLTIEGGPLAGTQIHLQAGPRGIEAAVLTEVASSRQTLVAAMDEVARRLRQKGHTLEITFDRPPSSPRPPLPDRHRPR